MAPGATKIQELATRLGVSPDAAQEIYQAGHADGQGSRVTAMRVRAKDIPLTRDLYARAADSGMNLSAYMEEQDPSGEYNDGLDAFERQLMLADIRTIPDLMAGIPASPVERFWASSKPGSEVLFPEFLARTWRRASLAGFASEQTQRFYASSVPVSQVMYPDFIQQTMRRKQIQPAIPLSTIIATVTPIDSNVYKAFYLTDSADDYTMKRVAEGAEIPTAKLTGGDHTINLKKYGRRLLASYESIRRTPIDRLALHLGLLAVKAEADKVATAVDVAMVGDGNASTAATAYRQIADSLDAAALAGELSLTGYLAWRMKWANPYRCGVILGQNGDVLQCLLLNTGTANVPFMFLVGAQSLGGFNPINPNLGGCAIGWGVTQVTASHLLGIDERFGLEMVTEIGASLTETDKIIGRQFNEIVLSEVLGFCVLDPEANKIISIHD